MTSQNMKSETENLTSQNTESGVNALVRFLFSRTTRGNLRCMSAASQASIWSCSRFGTEKRSYRPCSHVDPHFQNKSTCVLFHHLTVNFLLFNRHEQKASESFLPQFFTKSLEQAQRKGTIFSLNLSEVCDKVDPG